MRIMEKWFPTPEQEAEEERQAKQAMAAEAEKVREFLQVKYMPEFKKWLKETRRANEPRMGNDPSDMVYRTGLRDGIRLIEDRMEELEASLKRIWNE